MSHSQKEGLGGSPPPPPSISTSSSTTYTTHFLLLHLWVHQPSPAHLAALAMPPTSASVPSGTKEKGHLSMATLAMATPALPPCTNRLQRLQQRQRARGRKSSPASRSRQARCAFYCTRAMGKVGECREACNQVAYTHQRYPPLLLMPVSPTQVLIACPTPHPSAAASRCALLCLCL